MITETDVQTGSAVVDGLHLAYESVGAGLPTILFIHGAFGDRTYFAGQAAHFGRRFQVVSIDLRGHGASDPSEHVSIDDYAADVIAVAEAAGVTSAVLVGHSMGGAVALAVARSRPDLVRGICLLDGTVLFPEPVRRQGLEHLVPALGTDHWLDALRDFFSRTLDPQDPPELTARVMEDLGRLPPAVAQRFFTGLFASDFADALQDTQCPLLYVHAKAPADLQRLVELRPDAMVGQVVGAGHWLMLSVPDQVNAMLDRFLDRVTQTARPR
jgi:pimeloyl-ACP methyl ester carboxylesterase